MNRNAKLNRKNKAVNTWAVTNLRSGTRIIDGNKRKLKRCDRISRNLITT